MFSWVLLLWVNHNNFPSCSKLKIVSSLYLIDKTLITFGPLARQWIVALFHNPNREHVGDIDDSLMLSSIKSMIHQLYIKYCKNWWIFDVISMFHPCFQCFSTMKPAMFHLLNINDSSMKHQWIINERQWIVAEEINKLKTSNCRYLLKFIWLNCRQGQEKRKFPKSRKISYHLTILSISKISLTNRLKISDVSR